MVQMRTDLGVESSVKDMFRNIIKLIASLLNDEKGLNYI